MDYERMCTKIATRDLYIKYDVEIFEEHFIGETGREKDKGKKMNVLHKAQILHSTADGERNVFFFHIFFMISDCVKLNKNSCIYSTHNTDDDGVERKMYKSCFNYFIFSLLCSSEYIYIYKLLKDALFSTHNI